MTYGILLIVLPPGIELTPLALEVQDLATELPGKSLS